MLHAFVNTLAPHLCCSCGRIGEVLCEYCKYDIVSDAFSACIVCTGPTPHGAQLCTACRVPYARAWCVGARGEALKVAINRYKYDSARAAVRPLVDMLDQVVPCLPANTVVVAVPSIRRHVRMRGYDHAALLACAFARRRNLGFTTVLGRADDSVQQGASKAQRLAQAKRAFRCDATKSVPHLLIDDVFTTGATVRYAAEALRNAGASEVYVAVLSRQLLEKPTHL